MMTTQPYTLDNNNFAHLLDPSDTDDLVNSIRAMIDFDSIVILGYHASKKPIYLYDSINMPKELGFQCYLTSSFTFDPFYSQIIKEGIEGIFNSDDVLMDQLECNHYRNQFYYEVDRKDELAVTVRIDDSRSIALFLGRQNDDNRFSEEQKQRVFRQYNDIKELCLKIYLEDKWSPEDEKESSRAVSVHYALSTFGSEILTSREKEIIMLMIQGLANNNIAKQLQISVATVKVHRKSIYAKLNISNINEFWQLFLGHLMQCV